MSDDSAKSLEWKEIGGRIVEALAVRDMTQSDLAARLGTAPANVSNLIKGSRQVSEEVLARIAAILGVSRPFLRYGVADPKDTAVLEQASYERGRDDALGEALAHLQQLRARPMAARLLALTPMPSDANPESGSTYAELEALLSPIAERIKRARKANDSPALLEASRQFYTRAHQHVIDRGKSEETAAFLAEVLLTANGGTLSAPTYGVSGKPSEDSEQSPRINRR